MGLLERCHAYKDKVAQGIPADHGLFAYPVLQAADILIVRADFVPVGQDQKRMADPFKVTEQTKSVARLRVETLNLYRTRTGRDGARTSKILLGSPSTGAGHFLCRQLPD